MTVKIEVLTDDLEIGELIYDASNKRHSSVFRYSQPWLQNNFAFAISPNLPLQDVPFYFSDINGHGALPPPLADGTPDSWGQKVIKHALGNPKASDLDFLAYSHDFLRAGALQFRFDETDYSHKEPEIPAVPLRDVKAFAKLSHQFQVDPDLLGKDDARKLARAIGTLGGARPKFNVMDDRGDLWIAKLPKLNDAYDVSRVELLTLRLAAAVGIKVPEVRLMASEHGSIALIKRFDRMSGCPPSRIPYISAQTFMGLHGAMAGNYVDLAFQIREHGANPDVDLRELHRRLMFSILINNVDDHLRNHGFLGVDGKWKLSPAFDINPSPEMGQKLKTAISEDHGFEPSIEAVIEVAPFFAITEDEAVKSARVMGQVVENSWAEMSKGMQGRGLRAT